MILRSCLSVRQSDFLTFLHQIRWRNSYFVAAFCRLVKRKLTKLINRKAFFRWTFCNMFTVILLLSGRGAGSLHRFWFCLFKVDAEMPSVPEQPGTSSLPTWPPRRLCHWRRTAAAGFSSSPPPAVRPAAPPGASVRPAGLAGSPRTAAKQLPKNTQQDIQFNINSSNCLVVNWLSKSFKYQYIGCTFLYCCVFSSFCFYYCLLFP